MPYPKESLEEVFGLMYKGEMRVRNQRPRARVAAQAMLQTSASTVASPRPRLTKPPTDEKERSVNVLSGVRMFHVSAFTQTACCLRRSRVLIFQTSFALFVTQRTFLVEVTFVHGFKDGDFSLLTNLSF